MKLTVAEMERRLVADQNHAGSSPVREFKDWAASLSGELTPPSGEKGSVKMSLSEQTSKELRRLAEDSEGPCVIEMENSETKQAFTVVVSQGRAQQLKQQIEAQRENSQQYNEQQKQQQKQQSWQYRRIPSAQTFGQGS